MSPMEFEPQAGLGGGQPNLGRRDRACGRPRQLLPAALPAHSRTDPLYTFYFPDQLRVAGTIKPRNGIPLRGSEGF